MCPNKAPINKPPQRLFNILKIISNAFNENQIPYSLMGAMVLGYYGVPRSTCDIDFLAKHDDHSRIFNLMTQMGYHCYHQTEVFANFDSEMSLLGNIDVMFVKTLEGINMIEKSHHVDDEIYGDTYIVQPTDYIVLKLMAIANNPSRKLSDSADIIAFIKLAQQKQFPENLQAINFEKIYRFADQFGQHTTFESLLKQANIDPKPNGFSL